MSKTNSAPGVSGSINLVNKLCYYLSGKKKEDATRFFKLAVEVLFHTPPGDTSVQDEYGIVETIKKRLAQTRTEKEVYMFTDLHRKLQALTFLKNRQAILSFLMLVSDIPQISHTASSSLLMAELITAESDASKAVQPNCFGLPRLSSSVLTSTEAAPNVPIHMVSSSGADWRQDKHGVERDSRRCHSTLSQSSGFHMPPDANLNKSVSSEVSESELLQELIYSFQGVNGKFLKLSPGSQGYKLDPKVRVKRSVRRFVLRLAELGWLHNQVRQHCESAAALKTLGLIGQSLIAALREELTEYYRLVAVLQSQIKQQVDMSMDSPMSEERPLCQTDGLTLCRLSVWTFEPQRRMKCLAAVVEACKEKRGGALASCVHGFLQHGDPVIRETVKNLLGAVCKPMYVMLSRWILDGELEDPYGEFFIAADLEVKGDLLWHEKYHVLDSMVPSFIPLAQAKKILATGKSINFLREICQDHTPVKGREELKHALECTSVEALFMADREGDLQMMMDTAYLETSRRVLDVLIGQYKFLDHLQALRRYLLLGQGDFIRHLMELLEPELIKPATQLYPHNLSGILESAIRATNAQFEDEDILNRLDVRLLEQSPGDIGWDVFSLDYHVDGPIGTIFAQNSTTYLMLFNALWRAKRMEWILSGMWKRQITSAKLLRNLPELAPILQQAHLLTSEMVHFVHQMQYYILFEVLECSWDALIKQVQQAEALDDIIAAHQNFLLTVKAGALLDHNSRELAVQLRAVYELVLQLQTHEEELHARSLSELQALTRLEELVKERGEVGQFGTSTHEEELNQKRSQDFTQRYITSVRTQLRVLNKSYQDVVKKFLLMLASQSDVSLQLLSFRLDFNEHYKRLDSRLTAPLTYQHRRLSEMGSGKNVPGISQQKTGQTKFHKSQHFEQINSVPMLTEKIKPGIGGVPLLYTKPKRFPSLFARKVTELPTWLAFDKQVLCFEAFFQETSPERLDYVYCIRKVKILFFMEDGTIQVLEPTINNSGIPQGTLISRQQIPLPAPRNDDFYGVLDFNIGKEVELYGRVYKITNCDKYTRIFLNRIGVHVPDAINIPPDPYAVQRAELSDRMTLRKPKRSTDKLGQFLDFDRKVLRFFGYWDDRQSLHGVLHDLELHYCLADDTVEIKENIHPNSGCDLGFMFLQRCKLPKVYEELPPLGYDDPHTVLNVLSTGFLKGRYLVDVVNCGQQPVEYYKDSDLAIGAAINVFGRKIVLTDCDTFTKEYYATKYGLDDFTPLEHPKVDNAVLIKQEKRSLPPYNGYGTYEDSAANCRNLIPVPPYRDFNKFLNKDRQGLDSHILRFKAKLVSRSPADKDRQFVISYYLCDDTISVFENPLHNTGFIGGEFIKRTKTPKPGQEVYTSEPPEYFRPQDFYVGNIIILYGFEFILVDADEYVLRYMEINCQEFPKSNIILIMNKIREALKPIYKQFVCEFLKTDPNQIGKICYTKVSKVLKDIMGDNITQHELITLSRHYNAQCIKERYTKESLRSIVHTEMKRFLFNQVERLHESFLQQDPDRNGYVSRDTAYAICRGAKLPVNKDLLNAVLDKICKNEAGEIDYRDLLEFLDLKKITTAPSEPTNIQYGFTFLGKKEDSRIGPIDCQTFLKDLDLERQVVEESG